MDDCRPVYRERAALVAFLAAVADDAHISADPLEPDWPVVCIHTGAGQLTWHIAMEDMDLMAHVRRAPADWDGHGTEEKYRRLAKLTEAAVDGG